MGLLLRIATSSYISKSRFTTGRIWKAICPVKFSSSARTMPSPKPPTLLISRRTLQNYPRVDITERWHTKDRVPSQFQLIYHARWFWYVAVAQTIGLFSFIGVVISFAVDSDSSQRIPKVDVRKLSEDFKPVENEEIAYLTGFVLFCTCLFMVVHKLPLRVYHYPATREYLFVKNGWLPFTSYSFRCKLEDIRYDKDRFSFLWKDCSYSISNGKYNVVLFDQHFRLPSDVNILKGICANNDDKDDIY